MQCDMAIAITNTSSEAYQIYTQESQQIQDGNLTSFRIPYLVPTVLAKTFHPRTLGQKAYADLIMGVW